MEETGAQSASIDVHNPLNQQQQEEEINIPVASHATLELEEHNRSSHQQQEEEEISIPVTTHDATAEIVEDNPLTQQQQEAEEINIPVTSHDATAEIVEDHPLTQQQQQAEEINIPVTSHDATAENVEDNPLTQQQPQEEREEVIPVASDANTEIIEHNSLTHQQQEEEGINNPVGSSAQTEIGEHNPLTQQQQEEEGINNPLASHATTAIVEENPLIHQQQEQEGSNIPVAPPANTETPAPKKPILHLLNGSRKEFIKNGIPLYEASIKGDWNTAEDILVKHPEYVRYAITENHETVLHVAASAKRTKQLEEFVRNLMDKLEQGDLELPNKNNNTALCLAAAAGNIDAVKIMAGVNDELVSIPGSQGMPPLYMAVMFKSYEVVKYLYEKSNKLDAECWTPKYRGWLLQKCVEADMFDIALQILKNNPKHPDLVWNYGNVLGVLARKPDAFSEEKVNFFVRFYNWVFDVRLPEKESHALQLLRIIWDDIAENPTKIIDKILRGPPDDIKQDDKPPSDEECQARQLEQLIAENIRKLHVDTDNIIKTSSGSVNQDNEPASGNEDPAVRLEKVISQHTKIMHVGSQNIIRRRPAATTSRTPNAVISHSSRILFIAAEMGNTKFIVELIRKYPDLIWKVNDDNQSIFHIAVKHRHEGIYNLLYEIGSMKDLITPLKDLNDNNMLHLVGKSAKKKRLEDVSGVAFQMQRELLWFKEVENMIPPTYRERKNKDGATPYELFTKEHKDLVTRGEKWMKGTASHCMVVAALIATIVFAAAFTVPGGFNQSNDDKRPPGIPVFHHKVTFKVFVVADAVSLFLSSTSILVFLSILTSRYAERDFLESLPNKLMYGLTTLFLSIITMMIAFSVSFFVLLYHEHLIWMPSVIAGVAIFPVLVYAFLQYHLLADVIRSTTYASRYLFRPEKQVLYYENPRY